MVYLCPESGILVCFTRYGWCYVGRGGKVEWRISAVKCSSLTGRRQKVGIRYFWGELQLEVVN